MAVVRHEPFRDPFEQLMSLAASGRRGALAMPIDVYQTKDGSYHVEADLPGADADSIDVTVEHGTLTIRAQRAAHYAEDDHVVVTERPQGAFSRQLTLGESVDTERLTADYSNGVLHVTLPASPKVQPRRIQVTHRPVAQAAQEH